MNIYYSPEKFGLEIIDEVEWDDEPYQFNYTVVWRDLTTGQLFYASDSGCSCPSPFEDLGVNDLNEISRENLMEFIDYINNKVQTGGYSWFREGMEGSPEHQRRVGEGGEMIMKVRALL